MEGAFDLEEGRVLVFGDYLEEWWVWKEVRCVDLVGCFVRWEVFVVYYCCVRVCVLLHKMHD